MGNPSAECTWEEAVTRLIADPQNRTMAEESYFDRPVIQAVRRYAQSTEFEALRQLLPAQPGDALDVGAGNGILSYALARAGWKVVALEPDPGEFVGAAAIRQIARDEQLDIRVVQETCEGLSLPDKSFDLIVARQVFHHAGELDEFCRQLYRVLRPGGLILTFRDHVVDNDQQLQQFLQRHPLHRLYGGENAYAEKRYQGALTQAGFQIVKVYRHLDSPINFAPQTYASLRARLVATAGKVGLGWLVQAWTADPARLRWLLTTVGNWSRFPGRHVAFLGKRPGNG